MSQNEQVSVISLTRARTLVADLFEAKAWIYWTDFLVCVTIGYTSALIFLNSPMLTVQQAVSYLVAGVMLYRVGCFMHEIVHFRREQMTAFKAAWNIIGGIPMLTPSFMYESHIAHHNTHQYGTVNDGEYLPLGAGRLRNVFYFMTQIALLPLFVVSRFLFLVPLSFISPKMRDLILRRASSYVINFSHIREIPPGAPRRLWAAMDIACCLRAWAIPVVVLSGIAPWTQLIGLYAIAVMTLGLNHFRTLIAHRYRSNGDKMSHFEQLSDSVNISGGLLTELAFPLGLRYHALHHLYPSLPYHNLYEAHRRLMKGLPEDSPYHEVTYANVLAALKDLFASCREAMKSPPPGAETWYARRAEMVEAAARAAASAEEEAVENAAELDIRYDQRKAS